MTQKGNIPPINLRGLDTEVETVKQAFEDMSPEAQQAFRAISDQVLNVAQQRRADTSTVRSGGGFGSDAVPDPEKVRAADGRVEATGEVIATFLQLLPAADHETTPVEETTPKASRTFKMDDLRGSGIHGY